MSGISEDLYWTLLKQPIKTSDGALIQADWGTRTGVTAYGNPICGSELMQLASVGEYAVVLGVTAGTYYTSSFSQIIFEPENSHSECVRVRFVKSANARVGQLEYEDTNGNVLHSDFIDSPFNCAHYDALQPSDIRTDVYINLVCFIHPVFGYEVGFSLTGKIRGLSDTLHPELKAYNYEYSPTVSDYCDEWFDDIIDGKYWKPGDSSGSTPESGGGGGFMRRANEEVPIPSLPSKSVCDTGFVSLYEMTTTQLADLGNDLWNGSFFSTIEKNFASPFENIISLGIVPYDGLTGTLQQVKIGNYQSPTSGNILATSFFELDCGTLDIAEYYGTYADYSNYTQISLVAPFCGVIEISPDDCMSGKINVVYHIDVFSGSCVCFVRCYDDRGKTWHVLYQKEGNIKSEIPISTRDFSTFYANIISGITQIGMGAMGVNISATPKTKGKNKGKPQSPMGIATGLGEIAGGVSQIAMASPNYQRAGNIGATAGLMGVRTPYLIFTTPRMIRAENFKAITGYMSNLDVTIGNETGYLQSEVDFEELAGITATDTEIAMIKQSLSEGIYIREES